MAFASSKIGAQEAIIIPCDICEEEEDVNWYCKDCGQNMCDRCKRFHLKTAISKNHELLSISEGFLMGKQNYIQTRCQEHNESFVFACRTCNKNICTKCLSKSHKKHDFVDLRDIQAEVQKKLSSTFQQKAKEMQEIAENIDSLSRYRKDFHSYITACYGSIDERVQAIKDGADAEGNKLKFRLKEISKTQNEEIDKSEQSLEKQKGTYAKKISDTERELRMQTNTTLPVFAETRQSELEAMKPKLAKIPDSMTLFTEGKINNEHIRDMIGAIEKSPKAVSVPNEQDGGNTKICRLRNQINVVGTIGNKKIFPKGVDSVCSSRDGNIWMGSFQIVLKVDMNGKILTTIDGRESLRCHYIACFTSGDAIVSYGHIQYIDRFTSRGKRIDFADMSPDSTHDIAVTDDNQVVVNVNMNSLVILSEQGQKLREIKPGVGEFETVCLMQDGSYKIAERNNRDLVTVDKDGQVTRRQKITKSDIGYITCDRHGNVIASNEKDAIYVNSEDGEVVRTYQIPGKNIGRLAVDNNDRLLIVTDYVTITVAEYME